MSVEPANASKLNPPFLLQSSDDQDEAGVKVSTGEWWKINRNEGKTLPPTAMFTSSIGGTVYSEGLETAVR